MQRRNPDSTRDEILRSAFREIHEHGFQAASLDQILASTRLTKGALYHHFRTKRELGLAVVDEVIASRIDAWVADLLAAPDPIEGLKAMLPTPERAPIRLGCPLNNLAQEMAPIDDIFRERIEAVFARWRAGIAEAVRRGRETGRVRPEVDPERAAAFVLAAMEGSIGLAKAARSASLFETTVSGLHDYLDSLRAPTGGSPAFINSETQE